MGVGQVCSHTMVPWRPWSQATVTMLGLAPLSRENYPCVIAEQLTGHFKLAAKEQPKACWVLLVPASSVVSLTAGIIQKSLNITQESLA